MPAIRDFAVTEVTSAAATATPDMPEHESGDILVVFANKDSTTGMTETTGLYTLLQSGDITTTAWSGAYWRRATSGDETPPTFTWTSETANFVIVAVKGAHGSNAPTGYLSSDDSAIPFTQDQSISTPSTNCLVLHGVGNDVGIGTEPYPGVAQVLYGGDAGANGIGVSWAFYPASGSIGNPTFWGRAEAPTQIHTVVIEDDGNNAEVQGYVDRGTTPATIVSPLVGATLFGWAHQTSIQQLVIGNNWSQVWTYNGTAYTDETVDMNDIGTADVALSITVQSALYLGSNTTFGKFGLYVSTARAGGTLVWEYYTTGSAWATLPGVTDALTSTGAHSLQFRPPANWAQVDVNGVTQYYVRFRLSVAGSTAGAISQGLRDGAAVTYDTITAGADLGVNPYHNVAQTTPSSNAYNLGGNEMLFSGGTDLSSGYLVGTYTFTAPRDWVDLAFLPRLGIVFYAADTTAEPGIRAWIIGAKDGVTTYSDRRNIYAIQLDQATNTFFASRGTLAASAVARIGLVSVQPYGAMSLNFSMLMRTGTIVTAGGKSTDPLNFDELINAVNNGCSLFPMLYKVGSVATVWAPVRIGGGDPVHASINLRTFEFPTHYDYANKILDYHVDAEQNGIEFYGKSGDTVKFTNCVFTSGSPYYWRINSSASSGATWSFNGTSVVNATATLYPVTTFSNMSFIGCGEIALNGADIQDSTIQDTRATASQGAVAFTSAGEGDGIDRINFVDNNDGDIGHSIRIVPAATGTYTFDSHQFSGGGPAHFGFLTQTDVDPSADTIAETNHGYSTGDAVYYQDQGGTPDIGLADGSMYYVRADSVSLLGFFPTKADALANSNRVPLSDGAAEQTHYIYSAKADVFNNSGGAVTINVSPGGDTPTVRNSDGSSTTVVSSVDLTVTVVDEDNQPIQTAQVAIFTSSDDIERMNEDTTALGVATQAYSGATPADIYVRVRKSDAGDPPKYVPTSTIGTIASGSGFSTTITLIEDTNA